MHVRNHSVYLPSAKQTPSGKRSGMVQIEIAMEWLPTAANTNSRRNWTAYKERHQRNSQVANLD
jgi:hypothetical protein